MLLNIKRTSLGCSGVFTKPCEEAFLIEDELKEMNFEEMDAMDFIDKPIWWVKLETMLDLQDFIAKYGKVVVTKDVIEIYDYWRE